MGTLLNQAITWQNLTSFHKWRFYESSCCNVFYWKKSF